MSHPKNKRKMCFISFLLEVNAQKKHEYKQKFTAFQKARNDELEKLPPTPSTIK